MKLTISTVANALLEFTEALGAPDHINSSEKMDRLIFLYHRELAKVYTEEKFPAALAIAWNQARRFPVLSDFHRDFNAPTSIKENEPNLSDYY